MKKILERLYNPPSPPFIKGGMGGLIILIIALVANLLFPIFANADVINETLKGKDLIFSRKYDEAITLYTQIEKDYPESPAGTFGQMAAYQIRMFENLDFNYKKEYEAVAERFETVMYKLLQQKQVASWDLFVAGAAYGMRGFYYARQERWIKGLGSASRALQLLKRVNFQDPNFIDAYLGIGMYNYWRSAYTKDISFLPFFADKRALGIEQIENVRQHGLYAAELAESNLAFIYTNEKEYDKSHAILAKILQKYPNNVVMRQLSAKSYLWDKKYDESIAEFKQILKVDSALTKTLFSLGIAYMRKGDKETAKKYFNDFLATNPEKEWVESTNKNLNSL